MTKISLVVVKMPAEDYFDHDNPDGPRAVATKLAVEHGGTHTGGGTDVITGMSDLDFDVPADKVAGLLVALAAAGLPGLVFDAPDAP